jgi:hypothetical protein
LSLYITFFLVNITTTRVHCITLFNTTRTLFFIIPDERKKKMNSAIKRAAAVLAKPKAKPAPRRRPGVVRPNPVPEIQPASPSPKANAPYEVMSPSNMLEYAAKIESGRKKAANKLNARIKEIKATKGKTPTPVRLKEKFSFVNVKGKKREFVRKFAYDRALAKNKAEREKTKAKTPTPKAKKKFIFTDVNGKNREYVRLIPYEKALAKNKAEREKRAQPTFSERARAKRMDRGQPFNMKTPQNVRNAIKGGKNMKFVGGKFKTATPKAKWSNANNKQFMEMLAREKNAQRKLANEMNKARPLKNGPLDPAVAYAHKTPKNTKKINKYVNSLSNNERNMLKKKIC